ncbi:MAG: hypothetical protein KGH65_00745 [Candidatus Micrarchaeota archaeon]|nr:hypothetical protein [Candidatus Micrarchaeota archaeon]
MYRIEDISRRGIKGELRVESLAPETIFSAILTNPKWASKTSIEQVARMMYELEESGINTSKALYYRTGSSVYCDDLSRFVGKLVSFGYASDKDKIVLTKEGMELCLERARKGGEANLEQMERLKRFLEERNPD